MIVNCIRIEGDGCNKRQICIIDLIVLSFQVLRKVISRIIHALKICKKVYVFPAWRIQLVTPIIV